MREFTALVEFESWNSFTLNSCFPTNVADAVFLDELQISVRNNSTGSEGLNSRIITRESTFRNVIPNERL